MPSLHLRVRLSLLIVLLCLPVLYTAAQTDPEVEQIEERVERLLLKRDLGDLANELARHKSLRTTESLLMKLSVFARAGHRARVLETLKLIPRQATARLPHIDLKFFV